MRQIRIHKVEEADFDFFYLIKCDEDNIDWAGHSLRPLRDNLYRFFIAQIQHQDIHKDRTIYIVEEDPAGEKVGYLYLDPVGTDAAEVSIGILKSFSGQGYGREAVRKLCDLARDSGFQYISAMVREDNLRSQRMFQHAGFQKTDMYQNKFIQNLNREVKMIRFKKVWE
jgi:RimJ/RimL family protein N-acetyltransferase